MGDVQQFLAISSNGWVIFLRALIRDVGKSKRNHKESRIALFLFRLTTVHVNTRVKC